MPVILHMPTIREKAALAGDISRTGGKDLIDRQLSAAQEILAKVFCISITEAGEMIRERSREKMLWPERFSMEE